MDVGVIVVIAPVTLAALRLLFFSGGDPVLLRVLISTLDVPTVVLGTLLPTMPVLLWALIQPFNQDPGTIEKALGGGRRARWLRRLLLFLVMAIYLAIGPWPTTAWAVGAVVAGAVLVALIWWVVSIVINRRAGRRWAVALRPPAHGEYVSNGFPRWLIFALSAPLLVVLVFPTGFWLPQEVITLKGDPAQRVSGYVLEQDSGWVTFLKSDREVLVVRAQAIEARDVCDQSRYDSLITLLAGPGDDAGRACQVGAEGGTRTHTSFDTGT